MDGIYFARFSREWLSELLTDPMSGLGLSPLCRFRGVPVAFYRQ